MISGVVFVLGAIVGSFLNVVIYRLPQGLSIVFPGSHCPVCKTSIPWYFNVPILSYLGLRGRCGFCKTPIPMRYPLVEGLTGGLFWLTFYRFGLQWFTPVLWVLVAILICISFIDLDHKIIPDVLSIPGILVGFAASFVIPWVSWSDSLLGILLGGGSLYFVAVVYELLTKKEGMGGGDIKLLAMLGAFLGWKAILPTIFFASLLGTLIGIPLMIACRADGKLAIPFGPFLAVGALGYLFWGPLIIRWYLELFA